MQSLKSEYQSSINNSSGSTIPKKVKDETTPIKDEHLLKNESYEDSNIIKDETMVKEEEDNSEDECMIIEDSTKIKLS